AAFVTVLVVSAAGMGVVFMTQKNMIASADGDIKYNLGRAVDFMSEEVKTASLIRSSVGSINATNFSSTGKTVVLAISVPGVSQDIIYYTQAPGNPWLGNLAIYRWGPALDSSGAYTNATTPSAWTGQLLVDLIASAKASDDSGCPSGWSALPSATVGFFACVNSTNKMVEIHAAASAQNNTVSNPLGWGTGSGGGYAAAGEPTYGIITQAYARAN
ncbi:MAG: hypothetical protein ACKO2V_21760, partial [Snowella sp.]